MKLKRAIAVMVVLGAVGFLGWKIWDLAWNRPPELKTALSRFPYAETFQHVRDSAYPNVVRHARQIASFGSRQTGQRGCNLTVEYVRSQLEEMGFDRVTQKDYTVTVPVEKECSVVVEGDGGTGRDAAYEAHTLIPNCVQTSPTPPGGLRGKLVYLGFGTLDEWSGRDVTGAIAVLEFNSGKAWLKAIGRGALAVILLEPERTTPRETDEKYLDMVPVRATRVYVQGEPARRVRTAAEGSRTARVTSLQTLEFASAPYLEVTAPGTEAKAKTILLSCQLDARSLVPAMSWGGDEVWGAAAWLELARWFKQHPPKNNVRFVAFTGHWQDFTSSRNYVSEHLDEIGGKVPLVLGLDLSTEEKYLALVPDGWPQRGAWRGDWRWLEKLIWSFPSEPRQNWIDDIQRETGRRVTLFGDGPPAHPWVGTAIGPDKSHNPAVLSGWHYGSHEAWQSVGGLSAAWQTASLHRLHHNTPLDTFDVSYARRENLLGQLEPLFVFTDNILQIDQRYFPRSSVRYVGPDRFGYLQFRGQIKRYDEKTAWYKGGLPPDEDGRPLRNTFVYMVPFDIRARVYQTSAFLWTPLAPDRQKHRGLQSLGVRYLTKVNENGEFEFKTAFYQNRSTEYTFLAFALDDRGRILYASDLGRHGADEFKYLLRTAENWHIDQSITVFPCGSVTLFELFDRKRYQIGTNITDTWYVQWDTGYGQVQDGGQEDYMPVSEVKLYPSQTDAKSYLMVQYQDTAMVFLPAEAACEILLTRGPLRKFSLLRSVEEAGGSDSGAPASAPHGPRTELSGVQVEQGDDRRLVNTPLVLAGQMHQIDDEKLSDYGRYGVKSQEADRYFGEAARYITGAQEAREKGDAPAYETASIMAWRTESRAYEGRFRLLYDVVSTTIFYFVLLIPFSYLMERLLFPQPTYARSAAVAGAVFVVFVLLLLNFHPGFKLAGNIYVAIVSFLIIVFTLPALVMIVGQGLSMLKAAGTQYFQRHASEAERLGVLVAALSLSIANMRRRKLRTALTLGTISLLVLSLVLLTHTTSTSTTYPTHKPPQWKVMPYEGIQVYNTNYHVNALYRELVQLMESTYRGEALVIPRWYVHYGVQTNLKGFESIRLYGNYPEKPFSVYDLLGHVPSFTETAFFPLRVLHDPVLTAKVVEAKERPRPWLEVPTIQFMFPEETEVTHIERTLTAGRWFEPDDVEAIILSDLAAESIGARIGDTLEIEKFQVKLVGIFNHDPVDELRDVAGDQIVPIAFEENQPTPEEPTRYAASRVVFMPYKFQERYEYFPCAPYSVVILPRDRSRIPAIADELSKTFDNIDVYIGYKGGLNLISAFYTARVTGSGLMVMPLVVSFLMIFSVMMGSVHERTREIYIFSSVGLSPKHVAGMFLVESVVYAGIASVWGYFLGIILLHVFRVEGMLPETFYPNYLGVFVIYSVALAMLATVSSSLYPMYKASRLANPSLERTWRIDTEPEENRWEITFPFISNQESETRGILAFLKEFVEHHAGEGMGVFAVMGEARYGEEIAKQNHRLSFSTWLAPFERHITQDVVFEARKDPTRVRWSFHFGLRQLTGVRYMWIKSNKAFVDAFRKQMLVWRAFSDEVLKEYALRGRSLAEPAARQATPPKRDELHSGPLDPPVAHARENP